MKKNFLIGLLLMAISSTLPFLVSAAEGDMTIYNLGAGPGNGGVNYPVAIAFDGTNLWVATCNGNGSNELKRISLNGLILNSYPVPSTGVGSCPYDIAFDGTNIWVANQAYGGTYTSTGAVVKMSPNGDATVYGTGNHIPINIAFDGTNMWTTSHGSVAKITPTGFVTLYPTSRYPWDIAFDGTNMWTADITEFGVTKVSPSGGMTSWGTGNPQYAIAFDGTNMWTTSVMEGGVISKISPSGYVTQYVVPGGPALGDIAFDGTNMWVAYTGFDDGMGWGMYLPNDSVMRVSPAGSMQIYPGTGYWPFSIISDGAYDANLWTVAGGSRMWTADYFNNSITKIGTAPVLPCTLPWGGSIASGNSATAYQSASVVSPATCTSQSRTCTNGSLSGTYTNSGCTVTAALAIPTVTTPTATSITTTGATLGANVTSLGNPATITARGTCLGTTASPITNCVAEGGTTTGIFTHARTGLTSNTTYYYRGYADNSTGRGYSTDGTFTTTEVPTVTTPTVTSITVAGATLGANVTSLGNPATITARGTCWGTTINPTTNCVAATGTTTGVFTHARASMIPNTLYYYRGYADNSTGRGYSASGSFTTLAVPTVTTPTISSITTSGATLGANVISLGNPATITARGTCWGTTINPTTNCVAATGVTTGTFTHARASMTAGTTYYYRGYATNSTGTGYSVNGTFTTLAVPTVTTPTVTSITTTGATLGSNVTSLGSALSTRTDYVAGTGFISDITISPDGTSAYIVNSSTNTVSMFPRNTTTGALSARTDYTTGLAPYAVSISPDGKSVYVTNYSGGTVSMYARNTTTGTLSTKTDYTTGSGPWRVAISTNGASVYVVNRTSNTVSMFARNTTTGTLSAKTDYATGASPWGVTVSPDGTSVYVLNYSSNTVSMFPRNTTTGTLSAKTDYATGTSPSSVAISTDSAYVYVVNRNSNTVSMFPRNTTTGALSAKTDYTTGTSPYDMAISSDGTSVYVLNYSSNTVSMFPRNTTTGALSAKTDYTTGMGPFYIAIPPTGAFVYVISYTDSTISMFSSNAGITRGTCWGTTASPTTNCVAATGTTTGIFTHARTGLAANTTYYYRGYADNSTGRGYSADGTFTTNMDTPTAPTISGPTTLKAGDIGTYSFVSTDPQGQRVSYAVDWNSDGTDLWMPYGSVPPPGSMTYVNSGVSQSASNSWATPGTYTVRVLAQNELGGLNSAWTTYTIIVTCANNAINSPTCTQCGDNIAYANGNCVFCSTGGCTGTPGGNSTNGNSTLTCNSGAYNIPNCTVCPGGQTLVGSMCVNNCTNGATNPTACDACPVGQELIGGICTVITSCGDSTCNGLETILTCPADCKMKYQQF